MTKLTAQTAQTAQAPTARTEAARRPTLAAYVEGVKPGVTLDVWQLDLCARIERDFWCARAPVIEKLYGAYREVNIGAGRPYVVTPSGFRIDLAEYRERRGKGTRDAIHAPPQFGKSIIISQAYPAWILGYDPAHRFRLATYNISHSKAFSEVVLNILRGPEHARFFPGDESRVPDRCSAVKWFTAARRRVNDGQSSFTALGLQSGFVGTGADTLLMDDPYKSIEEALSEVIREKSWRFYTDTAKPRLDEDSNVFIMFHRYHQSDIAGMAIASGEFGLIRYAAVADGDYLDDESGRTFPDPLGREEGTYLSPRKPEAYYLRQQANMQAWNSQFQGRPTSKAGDFFDTSLIKTILPAALPPMLFDVRAWDNAATEGGGAYTAGVRESMDAAGNVYVRDVARDQVNTAGRELLQHTTAERDGPLVTIRHPIDPGGAGVDVDFNFRQSFKDYHVESERVTGTKEARAYNFSKAVNSGKVFLVLNPDGSAPDWHKPFKTELKNFPVGTYKDQVDAGADAYNHLDALYHRGLVVKGYSAAASLVGWSDFTRKYGGKIPETWEVAAGLRVSADSSLPSGYCVVARAAEFAQLGETVFVVAAERMYARDPGEVLHALREALTRTCMKGPAHAYPVWLGRDSFDVQQLAFEKYAMNVARFEDDPSAGLPETNWYFQARPGMRQPFTGAATSAHLLMLVDDLQAARPGDAAGLIHMRQELDGWSRDERGNPQPYGGVTLDCARMCLYNFALTATQMTKEERRETLLPEHLRSENLAKKLGTEEFVEDYWARRHANKLLDQADRKREKEEAAEFRKAMGGRPASHSRRKYRRS